ncbi:MAG: chemotaxis protein CheR [Gammaproteobacteria bacterium]|nr:chemotaxis protein CheR [Gammaproteobacteria bacterium]
MTAEPAREFRFTEADFDRVCRLIYRHAGIRLNANKESLVYSRLTRRLRALDLSSFARYLDRVEADAEEFQAFVNALTTNLTAFFRENHHFQKLSGFLENRRDRGELRIWSAAASTGEEAYSIAITAAQTYDRHDPPVRILATDVDTKVLETGQLGIYPLERVERLPLELKRGYFLRGKGARAGQVRVVDELRELIEFRPLNLLAEAWPGIGQYDAIFCRNVMIYFDKPTQLRLLERFVHHLKPGGLFFAGHSESFFRLPAGLKPLGKTSFEKSP